MHIGQPAEVNELGVEREQVISNLGLTGVLEQGGVTLVARDDQLTAAESALVLGQGNRFDWLSVSFERDVEVVAGELRPRAQLNRRLAAHGTSVILHSRDAA